MEPTNYILTAAEICFSEKGYQGTRIVDIARSAGVNPAVIYRYFPGKKQLFEALKRPDLDFKDPDRAEKEQIILQAGLRVFGRKGYKAATLDEIAAEAGLTKGGVYGYFESKEAIFKEVLDQAPLVQRMEPRLTSLLSDPHLTADALFTALAEAYLLAFEEKNTVNFIRVIISEGMFHPGLGQLFIQRVVQKNAQQISQRFLHVIPGDPAEAADHLQLFFGMLFAWVLSNRILPVSEAAPALADEVVKRMAKKMSTIFLAGLESMSESIENRRTK